MEWVLVVICLQSSSNSLALVITLERERKGHSLQKQRLFVARPGKTTPMAFLANTSAVTCAQGSFPAWLPSSSQALLHRPPASASASALLQPPLYYFLQSTYFILKPFFSGLFPLCCMAILALHDFYTFKLFFLMQYFLKSDLGVFFIGEKQ